jgi:hypothetical protein
VLFDATLAAVFGEQLPVSTGLGNCLLFRAGRPATQPGFLSGSAAELRTSAEVRRSSATTGAPERLHAAAQRKADGMACTQIATAPSDTSRKKYERRTIGEAGNADEGSPLKPMSHRSILRRSNFKTGALTARPPLRRFSLCRSEMTVGLLHRSR